MKARYQLLLITLLSVSFTNAQILDKLKKKAEKSAERTIERRVEKETSKKTDEVLDEVFEEKDSKSKKDKKDKKSTSKEDKNVTSSSKANSNMVTGSQFFPDGTILYNETFAQDAQGDFPANWETNSGGEIITVDGQKALRFYPNGSYINKANKLPENYALEFDLVTENLDYKGLAGSQFGIHFSNEKSLNKPKSGAKFAFSLWKGSTTCNQLLVESFGKVSTKIDNKIPFKMQDNLNTSTHFTMVVNGSRLRVFINNEKAIDLPSFLSNNLGNYIQFYLKGTDTNENHIVAISNIKITEEGDDIRSKILKGGFTTNQILFDSGSDKIKKESFEIMEKIGNVLKNDPNLKINIIGHTDSDGDEVKNMTLSKSRAAAVMNYFIDTTGIDKSRMQFQGRGENEPIADNTSAEGKAQNRRVEFQAIN
jgi:outer membrane protein OmpA-like peptidoglycan-associated protein